MIISLVLILRNHSVLSFPALGWEHSTNNYSGALKIPLTNTNSKIMSTPTNNALKLEITKTRSPSFHLNLAKQILVVSILNKTYKFC